MTRLLGIDLGERRIGLAIAEPGRDPAHPLATIPRAASTTADAERLSAVVLEQAIDVLVVGLPLNANGDEGPMAQAARAWAMAMSDALGIPMRLRDERLSSHRAEARIGPMPRGRSGGAPTPTQRDRYRSRVDREAAAIILEDELEAGLVADGAAQTGPESGR
ncbi:MAG: Holliday junction resolvase RuvX [Chloroflexi bacterium]|nr:Holliday junction resolvase RuvX [Chloroflexota bacterium]